MQPPDRAWGEPLGPEGGHAGEQQERVLRYRHDRGATLMADAPVVRASGPFKVFGRHPAQAVERLRAGASRDEPRSEGLTAAVIDASFEVGKGERFVVMGLSGSGTSTVIRAGKRTRLH